MFFGRANWESVQRAFHQYEFPEDLKSSKFEELFNEFSDSNGSSSGYYSPLTWMSASIRLDTFQFSFDSIHISNCSLLHRPFDNWTEYIFATGVTIDLQAIPFAASLAVSTLNLSPNGTFA